MKVRRFSLEQLAAAVVLFLSIEVDLRAVNSRRSQRPARGGGGSGGASSHAQLVEGESTRFTVLALSHQVGRELH